MLNFTVQNGYGSYERTESTVVVFSVKLTARIYYQ